MKKCTFKTQYTRTDSDIRDCNLVKFEKPSMVKESLSYATDINTIYDNYCKTGKVPLNGKQPIYDENFVNYDNLIEAQKLVDEASAYFQGLPTEIKNQYGNSLQQFVKAVHSGDKYLVDNGVLNIPTPKVDVKVDVQPVEPTVKPVKPSETVVSPTVPQKSSNEVTP